MPVWASYGALGDSQVEAHAVELGSSSRRIVGPMGTFSTSERAQTEKLLSIHNDALTRTRLQELEGVIALFERRGNRNKKEIRLMHDEIMRLVGLSSVVQVLLFLGVAQATVLECRHLWAPFLMSALSSIITFRGVYVKYRRISSLGTILSSEDETLQVAVKRMYELKQTGSRYFELSSHRDDCPQPETRAAVIDYFVVLPLVLFSAVVLASFWHMLCGRL